MPTPAEQKILDDTAAAMAAGEDVFGDDEELVREMPGGEDDDAEATPDAAETPAVDDASDTPPEADPLGLNEPPERAEQRQTFEVQLPADHEAKVTELMKEDAQAFRQLIDGEMDADAYAEIRARVTNEVNRINREVTRAETLAEANRQQALDYERRAIRDLIKRTTAEVPYLQDPKAQRQFDNALALLRADPDNAGADFAELANDAHKMVAAQRGIVAAKALASKAPPASRRPGDPVPTTLRGLPSASTQTANGSVADGLARLHGQDYEVAFAKLTPAQRAAMLD